MYFPYFHSFTPQKSFNVENYWTVIDFLGNYISKCSNLMKKRTPVPAYMLLLSLSNKLITKHPVFFFMLHSCNWPPEPWKPIGDLITQYSGFLDSIFDSTVMPNTLNFLSNFLIFSWEIYFCTLFCYILLWQWTYII